MNQPVTRMTTSMLAVLAALVHGENLYGLRIAEKASLRTGAVYPILARFEKAGWVTSSWGEDPEKAEAQRKYYCLTSQGRESTRAALRIAGELRACGVIA